MNDQLEQFITDNREGFDIFEPEPLLWEKIKLRKKDNLFTVILRNHKFTRIAAILVLAIGVWFVFNVNRVSQVDMVYQNESVIEIPELIEAETYYQAKFNEKMNEITPHLIVHPTIRESLDTDMAQLDSIYTELRNDLGDGMANEEIVDAMIQNYRMKLKILENLLFYIKKSKSTGINSKATENEEYEI